MTTDWGGYGVIVEQAKRDAEEDARKELVLCPICGNVLDENDRGEKNCDVGHFRTGSASEAR